MFFHNLREFELNSVSFHTKGNYTHFFRAVNNQMKVFFGICRKQQLCFENSAMKAIFLTMKCVRYENFRHHRFQADNHNMQQVKLFDHLQSKCLIREKLNADVNNAITHSVGIFRHFENARNATVVHNKSSCQVLFVILVGQHVEQKADDILRELKFEGPKNKFFEKSFMH